MRDADDGPPFPSDVADQLSSALKELGREVLSEQMKRVVIPRQGLWGEANEFEFLAYPWPRLTYEERCKIELQQHEPLHISLGGKDFKIDLDDFGQINWFRVSRYPALFERISGLIRSGNNE